MARRNTLSLSSSFFLQLSLGVFFLMLGIMGLGNYSTRLSEVARFFGRDDTMRVVMSVLEILMGSVLLLGLFFPVSSTLARILALVLFVLWGLYMVITFVLDGRLLEPNAVVWSYNLSWHAVILVGLWVVGSKYGA